MNRRRTTLLWVVLIALAGTACRSASSSPPTSALGSVSSTTDTSAPTTSTSSTSSSSTTTPAPSHVFETLPPGSALPDEADCAGMVLADPSTENRPDNDDMNATIVDVPPGLTIDGADDFWNSALAPRITGDFTGTTEQILRWGACKWGFDEDLTRARAVTESSWRATNEGDDSDDPAECGLIGLDAPCAQSYGLLQVKGTVHRNTYPQTVQSSAFGVDYAMAWLRACYEGSFIWLHSEDGLPYEVGNELGCVGAWFSGEWWDQAANDYVGEVRFHLERRTWETIS